MHVRRAIKFCAAVNLIAVVLFCLKNGFYNAAVNCDVFILIWTNLFKPKFSLESRAYNEALVEHLMIHNRHIF